jgi:hypothetical protein
MEHNSDLEEAVRAIKNNIVDDTSWFRDTPHYWAEALLPLAYALACVEVVSKISGKASYSPNGTSLQTQLEACRKYCQARRYEAGH